MAEEVEVGSIGVGFIGNSTDLARTVQGLIDLLTTLQDKSKEPILPASSAAGATKVVEAFKDVEVAAEGAATAGKEVGATTYASLSTILKLSPEVTAFFDSFSAKLDKLAGQIKAINDTPINPRVARSRGVTSASGTASDAKAEAEDVEMTIAQMDKLTDAQFKAHTIDLRAYQEYYAERLTILESALAAEDALVEDSLEYQTLLAKTARISGFNPANPATVLAQGKSSYLSGAMTRDEYKAQVQAQIDATEEGTMGRIVAERHMTQIVAQESAERLQLAREEAADEAQEFAEAAKARIAAEREAADYILGREAEMSAARAAEARAEVEADAVIASAHKEATASWMADQRFARAGRAGGGGQAGMVNEEGGINPSSGWSMLFAGGAILTPIVESIKTGAEFEAALHKLQATAGDTTNFEVLREELLKVANQFDQMPIDVAEAFYPIESAGFKGADGLTVLSAAAGFARGTQTDLATSATLVTKTMLAYGLSADQAGRVTDVFTRAVKNSLVAGSDFTPALAGIIATGHAAGLTLEELVTALDLMTQQTKSASTGSTYLKNFLTGIVNPGQATIKMAEKLKLGWLANKDGMEEIKRVGFKGVLDEIAEATHHSSEAQMQLFPDMRKNQAELILLSDGGTKYGKILKDNVNSMGATHDANVIMDKDLQQAGKDIGSLGETAEANITHALEPQLLDLAHVVEGLLKWFNALPPIVQATSVSMAGLLGALLTVMGGVKILLGGLAGLEGAFALTSGASVSMATIGTATFASGGPYALALIGIAALVGALVIDWANVEAAQQQAADSMDRYNAKIQQMQSGGERTALQANMTQIAEARSSIQDQIDAIKNPPATAANIIQGAGLPGFETDAGTWSTPQQTAAKIAQLNATLDKLNSDYKKEQARLTVLDKAPRAVASSDTVGPLGTKIAEAADKSLGGVAGECEHLANTFRKTAGIFDKFHGGSAAATMNNLLKAGLLQPYNPSMPLKPGDQLFSTSLGHERGKDGRYHDFGHVETVNSAGDRVDESGIKNRFSLSSFQYMFDPDAAAAVLSGRGTLGGYNGSNWQPPAQATPAAAHEPAAAFTALSTALPTATKFQSAMAAIDAEFASQEIHAEAAGKSWDKYTEGINLAKAKLAIIEPLLKSLSTEAVTAQQKMDAAVTASTREHGTFAAMKVPGKGATTTYKQTFDNAKRAASDSIAKAKELKAAYDSLIATINTVSDAELTNANIISSDKDAQAAKAEEATRKSAEAVAKILSDRAKIDEIMGSLQSKSDPVGAMSAALESKIADMAAAGASPQQIAAARAAGAQQNAVALTDLNIAAEQRQADMLLKLGQISQDTYQGKMLGYLQALRAEYDAGTISADDFNQKAAPLAEAVISTDWQAATDMISEWQDEVKDGTLSLDDYIAALQRMEKASLSADDSKVIKGDIAAAQKQQNEQMEADAKKTADTIAGYFGKAFDILTSPGDKKDNIRKAFEETAKEFEKKSLNDFVSKTVTAYEMRGKKQVPAKDAAAQAAADANAWVTRYQSVTGVLVPALQTFANAAIPLAAALQNYVGGTGKGPTSASGGAGSGPPTTPQSGGQQLAAQAAAAASIGVLKGGTSVGALTSDAQAGLGVLASVGDSSHVNAGTAAIGELSSGLGDVSDAVKVAPSLIGTKAAASLLGGVSSAVSAAMPYVGLAMAAAQIFGVFGSGGPSKYAVSASMPEQHFQNVFTDYSPIAKSSYAGVEGMRSLLGATTMSAAGVHAMMSPQSAPIPANHTINITVNAASSDPTEISNHIINKTQIALANQLEIDNARRGQ